MSDVIEDVKEKNLQQFEDGARLYRFVQRPGPLNFIDDTREGGDSGTRLSKGRDRPAGTCFANACAFSGVSECHWKLL